VQNPLAKKDSAQEKFRKVWPVVVTVLGLVLVYFLALRVGAAFVYFGYVSYDTCWLLKLGQLIAQGGAIPKTDPFTFTLPLAARLGEPQPYVVYQWLSEVLFFHGYQHLQPVGLLIAGALITVIAFLSVPLRACIRVNAPPVWSFLALAAACTASCVRCYVRPEVFSCLFFAIWLVLLQRLRIRANADSLKNQSKGQIDWLTIGLLTLLMLFWCNMHTAYVSGIILLAIYAIAFWLDDILGKRRIRDVTKTLLIGLLVSVIASLFNPYGIGLWLYLPHLYFAPVNEKIRELKPLTIVDLVRTRYFPVVCLVMLCYGAILATMFYDHRTKQTSLKSPARLSSVLIVIIATIICFTVRRLVSLMSLSMLFETANFIGRRNQPSGWLTSFWRKKASYLVLELVILVLAPRGVLDIAGPVVTLCIPQNTDIFEPPLEAMTFFTKNYKGGRIFSALEISDMLELYTNIRNSIFMDTRLDAFSEKIRSHFETIILARPGWRKLLDWYEIEWVFLVPKTRLGPVLETDPDWKEVYQDPTARIFHRVSLK